MFHLQGKSSGDLLHIMMTAVKNDISCTSKFLKEFILNVTANK